MSEEAKKRGTSEATEVEAVVTAARAMVKRYERPVWGVNGVEYDSQEHQDLAVALVHYDVALRTNSAPIGTVGTGSNAERSTSATDLCPRCGGTCQSASECVAIRPSDAPVTHYRPWVRRITACPAECGCVTTITEKVTCEACLAEMSRPEFVLAEHRAEHGESIPRTDYAPSEREALLAVVAAARAYVPYPARTVDERHDPRRLPLAVAIHDFDATQKRSDRNE